MVKEAILIFWVVMLYRFWYLPASVHDVTVQKAKMVALMSFAVCSSFRSDLIHRWFDFLFRIFPACALTPGIWLHSLSLSVSVFVTLTFRILIY